MTIRLDDAAATETFGRRLGALLRPGDVIGLSGPLGAGKTTLARGILAALGHEGEVASPSFPIVIAYEPPAVMLPMRRSFDDHSISAKKPTKPAR